MEWRPRRRGEAGREQEEKAGREAGREAERGRERQYPISALELLSQTHQLLQLPLPQTPNEILGGGPRARFNIQSELGRTIWTQHVFCFVFKI